MDQTSFMRALSAYEHQTLRTEGVERAGDPTTAFSFVYRDDKAAQLMMNGKFLGEVALEGGAIHYDPPLTSGHVHDLSREALNEWASLAYARSKSA